MGDSRRLENVTYRGVRTSTGEGRVTADGEDLPARLDLLDRRPSEQRDDGTHDTPYFEWGGLRGIHPHRDRHSEPGHVQLALAILAHAADDETALRKYRSFGQLVINRLDRAEWRMTRAEVLNCVASGNRIKSLYLMDGSKIGVGQESFRLGDQRFDLQVGYLVSDEIGWITVEDRWGHRVVKISPAFVKTILY